MMNQIKKQAIIDWNQAYYTKQAEGKHGQKWINNRMNAVIEKLNNIESAQYEIEKVKITVEWTKSKTWGNNPTATVEVFTNTRRYEYIGTASGCGYDKESASVAQAMNQANELLNLIYTAMDEKAESKPYGVNDYDTSISFAGGVGMSCYRTICEWLGFKHDETHGKSFDIYTWTK